MRAPRNCAAARSSACNEGRCCRGRRIARHGAAGFDLGGQRRHARRTKERVADSPEDYSTVGYTTPQGKRCPRGQTPRSAEWHRATAAIERDRLGPMSGVSGANDSRTKSRLAWLAPRNGGSAMTAVYRSVAAAAASIGDQGAPHHTLSFTRNEWKRLAGLYGVIALLHVLAGGCFSTTRHAIPRWSGSVSSPTCSGCATPSMRTTSPPSTTRCDTCCRKASARSASDFSFRWATRRSSSRSR